jgi:hypothetical protein
VIDAVSVTAAWFCSSCLFGDGAVATWFCSSCLFGDGAVELSIVYYHPRIY